MEDRRLAAHPIRVAGSNGVYVRAVLYQHPSAIYGVELSTDVKGGDAPAGCERPQEIQLLMEPLGKFRNKAAQR